MHQWIGVWFQWVHDWGYPGIVLLMAMESSVIPIPSEIVIPPAAYWATQGRYSLAGVVIAGTTGSYLGAAITYWVARWIGRPLMVRYGRYIFCPEGKLLRAERWLSRYEAGGIFFARLVPAKPEKPRRFKMPDIMARLRANFGDKVYSAEELQGLIQESRGERS